MSKIYDATAENFQQLVIEGSNSHFILLDFWADWCQPCKALKPVLELLTNEFDYILVKVNTEENQELAQHMGVRGIPDVRLIRDGAEVDRFSGALPETDVRAFLSKHLSSSQDNELNQAMMLASNGDVDAAMDAFNQLISDNPDDGKVLLAAAQFLTSIGKPDDAVSLLKCIKQADEEYATAQAMLALGEFRQACAGKDSLDGLDRMYADAACAAISQQYEQALEGFLDIVRQNKSHNNGAAHKAMLTLFEALGRENQLVQSYQRQLASALF